MNSKRSLLEIGVFLLLVLVLVYANHFDNDFHFDDSHTVVDNVNIRNLKNIPQFFTDPSMFSVSQNHRGLRPLVTTSLAIDYWLGGGLNPWMFQLSTFLWHIGLCIMLFFLFRQLLNKVLNNHQWVPYIAILGAGWFGLHTVMAETLNYIISRSDVLSTFFIVAASLVYIAYPERRKSYIYVLMALLGVLAKETVPVLPIILFFYIILFEENLSLAAVFKTHNWGIVGRAIVKLLPLAVAVAALQLYTLSGTVTAGSASHGIANSPGNYLLTQSYVWFHYFRSFFFPFDLSADTDMGIISDLSDPRILLGILFVVALVITIFVTSRRKETRPVSFGLIWFAASLLPTSLVPFAEVMNDHRMYFAFVGLTLSVVTTIGLIVIRRQAYFERAKNYRILFVAAFLIIGANAFGVYQRNKVWDSEESLWKDVTQKSPGNGRGWMNYGLTLMNKADFKGAIGCFKRAQETNPTYSTLYINFGIAYAGIRDSVNAVDNFARAITFAPDNFESYTYFARYYTERSKYLEAKGLAEKAMSLNPVSYMAKELAMTAYQGLAMWNELEATAQSTLSLVPGDAKALQFLEAARKKTTLAGTNTLPGNLPPAEALINLSLQQYRDGNYEGCVTTCRLALQADPNNADAYNNICAAYNMLQEWEKAKEACAKALQLNPKHPNAPSNMKWALTQKQ